MILFNEPPYLGKEDSYIVDAIKNEKHISGSGKYSKLCHEFLQKLTGSPKVLLTTSGTDALEMAAILCDIKEGDEVIVPSYTFVSSAMAFVMRGAKIVFVDVRPDTMNIDETKIEAAITDKTKVIVPVHYAGELVKWIQLWKLQESIICLLLRTQHKVLLQHIRADSSAQSVILAATLSTKQRITVWVRVAQFSLTILNLLTELI